MGEIDYLDFDKVRKNRLEHREKEKNVQKSFKEEDADFFEKASEVLLYENIREKIEELSDAQVMEMIIKNGLKGRVAGLLSDISESLKLETFFVSRINEIFLILKNKISTTTSLKEKMLIKIENLSFTKKISLDLKILMTKHSDSSITINFFLDDDKLIKEIRNKISLFEREVTQKHNITINKKFTPLRHLDAYI